MRTKEPKIVNAKQEYISNVIFDNSLNGKKYTSSKLSKINAILAKADLKTFLAKP